MAGVAMTGGARDSGIAVRISVTDRCPLRCLYCRPSPEGGPRPPTRLLEAPDITRFVRVVRRTLGLAKVRLTGGEPLSRGDIIDVVAALAPLGIPDVALTTNGQRLAALALPLRQAGLDRINISLDSLDADTFTRLSRGGELARTLGGIEAARAAGLTPVRINMVVLRGLNDHEAEDMMSFAIANGCEVRFIELMPSGISSVDFAHWFLPAAELRARLAQRFDISPAEYQPGSSSRRYRVATARGQQGFVGFISPNSHPFCAGCRRLRLTADGRLLGCLGRSDHIEIMDLLRSDDPDADERIASSIRTTIGLKRGVGPFSVAVPMSSVGG